jgi:beta-mannosidase
MTKINLSGTWSLRSSDGQVNTTMELPGDVITALIDSKIIPHPYKDRNELELQWVNQLDWILEKNLEIPDISGSLKVFHAEVLDTVARVELNGREIGRSDTMFVPARFPLEESLKEGTNNFKIYLDSAERTACDRAEEYPYAVPTQTAPVQSPHRNFLRKVQCHSGWDWGPCLMTAGVYNAIELNFSDIFLDKFHFDLDSTGNSWTVRIQGDILSGKNQNAELRMTLAGTELVEDMPLTKGRQALERTLRVESPDLWWPNGEGKQALYPLKITLGREEKTLKIGFRTIEVINQEDETGLSMFFRVNGRDIFAKGANWIPTDALPSGQDDSKLKNLLESSVKVHMNMLRVWGGGQYESEDFYNLCDELGLLIWQDFMFACSLYPTDKGFLQSVDQEVRTQILRLKNHACLALFCGNNEDVGALTWYEESRKNRDLYLIDYDRLNEGVIAKAVSELAPGHKWWPSSPSAGEGDYSDCWHDDSRGDMHYWSVWHEGKPFESYYDILPRFCSEFGFQSFPSFNMVRDYAGEEEWNVTSPVMMHHQKNEKGNEIIISTLSRYFRFPQSFKDFLYLSQVQQAWAIQTAVEYWRGNRPTCMGALYWQLNDNWPVASWASIDYSGAWKLLHYSAARFFAPLHIAGWMKDGKITAVAMNDKSQPVNARAILNFRNFQGEIVRTLERELILEAATSQQFYCEDLPGDSERQKEFLELILESEGGTSRNILLLQLPRMCSLEKAEVKMSLPVSKIGGNQQIELTTDKPAFYIYIRGEKGDIFSDNGFHMIPGEKKIIEFTPSDAERKSLEDLELTHLRQTY